MNQKKLLMGTLAVMLGISTSLKGDYISEAARMLNNKDVELSKLKENFSKEDVRKIENKAKELKLENLKKQKELEEEEETEKVKKLKEISNKQKKEDKDTILVSDLEKNLNQRFEKLEKRVSNLEKGKNTNVNAAKVTKESKKNPKVSKTEAVQGIIQGKYGDGEQRKEELKKIGFTESEVKQIQKEVNRILEQD